MTWFEDLTINKIMIIKLLNITTLSLFSVLIFSACSNSSHQENQQSETKASVISLNESSLLVKTGTVKGEYESIKITENLKDSVEKQNLPKIWLEFEQENGEILKTELDDKYKENLNSVGRQLFYYRYIKYRSENTTEIANAAYNHSKSFGKALNSLRKLEIDLPNGKRKMTEDEVIQVLDTQSEMINKRYFELDDHFYPKSSFYRFKESVNEKLGYQIF